VAQPPTFCRNVGGWATLALSASTRVAQPTFYSIDQINRSGIVERDIVFKTYGLIKERTQTSTERGIDCQRNGYWLATNHLSGHGLCSQARSCRLRQEGVPEGAVH